MADNSKRASIPSWQQATSISESTASSETPIDHQTSTAPQLNLQEHARRFLDDPSIRDASRERKVAFLKEKGVSEEDIEKLLSESSSSSTTNESVEDGELKTIHDSTVSTPATSLTTTEEPQAQMEASEAPRITPRTNVPPIITYPEFLTKPQKPPPLVTAERLFNAAYTLAGISALTYGASKYLVQPMLESLTAARHDLYTTTNQSLTTLNSKLESSVSHIPYIPPLHPHKDAYHDEDAISVDSDPTELFHRDIATQTTPPKSRSSSTSQPTVSHTIDSQATALSTLHTTLSSLLSSTQTNFSSDALQTTASEFQTIITNLEGNSQPLTSTTPYLPFDTTATLADRAAKQKQSEADSAAAKFKAEIRNLKGAFLSSRNFPTVRPAIPFTMPSGNQSSSTASAR